MNVTLDYIKNKETILKKHTLSSIYSTYVGYRIGRIDVCLEWCVLIMLDNKSGNYVNSNNLTIP